MEGIISSLIVSGLGLIGVIITNIRNGQAIENKLTTSQAVTDTKLDMLTEEVRKHNNFASDIPVMKEQIKVMNHRIDDLERVAGGDLK